MIHELLTEIGLSEKETALYIALLRSGTQPISFLAKQARLNRGTAYVTLHSLLAKGLVLKTTHHKIQHFAALDPKQLIQYLDHKQLELRSQREKAEAMMGSLIAITNPLTAKPKIQFFDGPEGARFVLNDTLTSQEKLLRAFLSIADVADFVGSDFFNEYTNRRVDDDYELHAIRTLEKDRQALARDTHAARYVTSRKEHREIRYVSDELAFPITIYMYDNKLAILSSKEENFALLIESHELAEMQKKLFDLLWPLLPKQQAKAMRRRMPQ